MLQNTDLVKHFVVLLHGVVHLLAVGHGQEALVGHERNSVWGKGGQHCAGKRWTNSLQKI